MRRQNAGRGGLLYVGYPHQGTVNDGIVVREGLFAVAATREHFSAVSARPPGHRAEKCSRVAGTRNQYRYMRADFQTSTIPGAGEGTLSASRSRERGNEGNDESVWGFKWRRVSSMENHR